MPREIEHKFLVRSELLPRPLPRGKRLIQGYLSVQPVVRVRIAVRHGGGAAGRKAAAFLTIKGPGLRERDEYEYAIPVNHARRLLRLCGPRTLTKIRRLYGGWEVDEFQGRHRGLWLAEYELASRRARLPRLPAWVGREVTGDRRYGNAWLASSAALPPCSP